MPVLKVHQHELFAVALQKRLWALESLKDASVAAYREVIYSGDEKASDEALEPNARRLRNRPEIKARVDELMGFASKIAALDAGWAMLRLAALVEGSSLGNYLTPRQKGERRRIDIDHCTDAELAQLAELQIDEKEIETRKGQLIINRKVRVKRVDPMPVLALMARIGGWEAPKKVAATDAEGNDLDLLEWVHASYALAEKRAAEAKARENAAA